MELPSCFLLGLIVRSFSRAHVSLLPNLQVHTGTYLSLVELLASNYQQYSARYFSLHCSTSCESIYITTIVISSNVCSVFTNTACRQQIKGNRSIDEIRTLIDQSQRCFQTKETTAVRKEIGICLYPRGLTALCILCLLASICVKKGSINSFILVPLWSLEYLSYITRIPRNLP